MKVKEKMAVASISKTLTKLGGGSSFLLSHRAPPRLYSSSAAAALSSAPQLSSSSQDQENVRKGSAPSSTWSKWLLFLPGAISFGLGTWQIFRRQDKIKMLEYRQNRLQMDPLRLNITSPLTEDLKSLEFRRVICQGVFDEQRSIYVGPRSRSISGVTENGYYVITPLMPIPNNPQSVKSPVLVNRGWVPRSWRDKSSEVSRDSEQPLNLAPSVQQSQQSSWWWFWLKKPNIVEDDVPSIASVEVVGVVRGSEKPSIFVPANDPSSCQWFYVDVPAIACACGLPENTVYIEDTNENVNPSNPYPLPKDVSTLLRSSVMPQDHLNYTLTWYSLSAAVTFMAFKRLRPKKSRR
ncbi:Surfeit locus protein 1 [Citrus sinensis]|uniref:surfeit locus protein 1-like isoform X1 n=1 Tax=Citrus sinensis TaxID=2711 RepID=UPI0021901CC1|nr:surfeit locus protein 1-like isoform X1 [Citrus sinensis]KAH9741876.1 Surfeit locus protein 1 [Citrus sinensis]